MAAGGGDLDADALEHLALVEAKMEAIKDFFGSFMLTELLKGMRLTGKYFFKRNRLLAIIPKDLHHC